MPECQTAECGTGTGTGPLTGDEDGGATGEELRQYRGTGYRGIGLRSLLGGGCPDITGSTLPESAAGVMATPSGGTGKKSKDVKRKLPVTDPKEDLQKALALEKSLFGDQELVFGVGEVSCGCPVCPKQWLFSRKDDLQAVALPDDTSARFEARAMKTRHPKYMLWHSVA